MVSYILESTETTSVDKNLFSDSKDKSNSIKQQHLDNLKTRTYIIYTLAAILASVLSSIYSYYAFRFVRDGLNFDTDEYEKDFSKNFMLRWISSAIFTAG